MIKARVLGGVWLENIMNLQKNSQMFQIHIVSFLYLIDNIIVFKISVFQKSRYLPPDSFHLFDIYLVLFLNVNILLFPNIFWYDFSACELRKMKFVWLNSLKYYCETCRNHSSFLSLYLVSCHCVEDNFWRKYLNHEKSLHNLAFYILIITLLNSKGEQGNHQDIAHCLTTIREFATIWSQDKTKNLSATNWVS